jgi:protein TonB
MFQDSLVESTPILRSRNRWPALISFATQAALVSILIAIPILHPEVLPIAPIKLSRLDPPPLPHPVPPPPTQMVHISASTAPSIPSATLQPPQLTQPGPRTETPPVDAPMLPLGNPQGDTSNPLAMLNHVGPPSPRVVAAAPSGNAAKPLQISTGVLSGMLLAPIQPAYPPIARSTGTQGTVVIQAIISKSGRIESTHVVSGSPLLQDAALQAVRAARYRPYLLNGQPTEVETTISIVFRLGS